MTGEQHPDNLDYRQVARERTLLERWNAAAAALGTTLEEMETHAFQMLEEGEPEGTEGTGF